MPNSQRINRGGMVLSELVETSRSHAFTDVVVLHEHRGEPDGMVVCHLPFGPTAYFGIFNTVLRHDIGQKKEVRAFVCDRVPQCVCVCARVRVREGADAARLHRRQPGGVHSAGRAAWQGC